MVKSKLQLMVIGLGVLVFGVGGAAIATYRARAVKAASDRDQLQVSLRELQEAKAAVEDDLATARQEFSALQARFDDQQDELASAAESKRIVTQQLAETQAENRELSGVRGTLELRDEEVAGLVRQLEQLRSDHEFLLAQRDGGTATAEPGDPDDFEKNDTATLGLVPVPDPSDLRFRKSGSARGGAAADAQVSAKPAASPPVRFDDRGWKSVFAD